VKKGLLHMLRTKCKTLIKLLLQTLNKENRVGTHSFTLHNNSIITCPCPTFPWTHNNNEAITICDGIYNMERVGILYPMPWCARFLRVTHFQKGQIFLVFTHCMVVLKWIANNGFLKDSTLDNDK
jgi:hypothetical protein